MSAEQPTPTTSDHRADIIAGLRAFADFLEARPDIPEPRTVDLQYSVVNEYDPQTSRIRIYGGEAASDGTYIVHANLTGGDRS